MTVETKALLQLFAAAFLWGIGFVATIWSIHSYTPAEAVTYRFFFAALFGFIILFFGDRKLVFNKVDFMKSLPAGFLLGFMQLTQTLGLQTTTAGKSGFLTSLYVILVPLISTFFLKKSAPLKIYAFATLSLVGTVLLVKTDLSTINAGDSWTFAGAIFVALHIIYLGHVAPSLTELFRFNTFQSFWAFLIITPLLFFQSEIHLFTFDFISLGGVLSLSIGSSLLAFYLQVKAQQHLSNSTTAMVSLVESPVAATFGFLLLGETLNTTQICGALIILISSILTIMLHEKS